MFVQDIDELKSTWLWLESETLKRVESLKDPVVFMRLWTNWKFWCWFGRELNIYDGESWNLKKRFRLWDIEIWIWRTEKAKHRGCNLCRILVGENIVFMIFVCLDFTTPNMTLQLKGYGHVILFTGETGKKEINTLFNGSQESICLYSAKN